MKKLSLRVAFSFVIPFFASLAEHLNAQSRKGCLRLPWLSPKCLSFVMKFEATTMRSSC